MSLLPPIDAEVNPLLVQVDSLQKVKSEIAAELDALLSSLENAFRGQR
jgi:hypothetical protein